MTDLVRMMAKRLRCDETVLSAWSMIAEPLLAETLARAGYGAVTLDMQHGAHDLSSVIPAIVAVTGAGVPTVVRVPVGDFATASRALDYGAAAVIAPMINSVEDARRFVSFMKYPPVGQRSWGPMRAAELSGTALADHHREANDRVLAFAMIETREAIDALDEILDIDGIDGVFVGPADLSIALSDGARLDPQGPETKTVTAEIAARAREADKIAGMFCTSLDHAGWAAEVGFRFIAYGVDAGLLASAAGEVVAAFDER